MSQMHTKMAYLEVSKVVGVVWEVLNSKGALKVMTESYIQPVEHGLTIMHELFIWPSIVWFFFVQTVFISFDTLGNTFKYILEF